MAVKREFLKNIEGTFNHHFNPGAKVGVVSIKGREIRSKLELFELNIDI
ncbi:MULTISPECIES: hypothetical protein [unclassified Bacillus (in: firmicutes)]|nr:MULTISPECIES: hypothetical protein [unclassified Bacillus (in: firmicutes)]MBT2614873.1 hypothetical protein [Bacillus sp. ISL-78]MBT2631829.1 hypothetical protein [Bacillus sp. ISL-101]